MTAYDCFNGDADGICALTQLRLAAPREATLVTGVKRDIKLLERVDAGAGDQVTALDVSLDKNRADLQRILDAGAEVFYCDHHHAGEIPQSENLDAFINTAPDVCTSLLINQRLQGQFLQWAVVGTFGDNLERSAIGLAKGLDCSAEQLEQLKALGIYINYNGYGASLEDLYFEPSELFQKVSQFSTALEFIAEDRDTLTVLEQGYMDDMQKAAATEPSFSVDSAAVYELPNEAWARRVSGVFGNQLANENPRRAHAVLTRKANGNFLVSVRAPLENKQGADEICRQFETGGGRAAAAGINDLPDAEVARFERVLQEYYAQA